LQRASGSTFRCGIIAHPTDRQKLLWNKGEDSHLNAHFLAGQKRKGRGARRQKWRSPTVSRVAAAITCACSLDEKRIWYDRHTILNWVRLPVQAAALPGSNVSLSPDPQSFLREYCEFPASSAPCASSFATTTVAFFFRRQPFQSQQNNPRVQKAPPEHEIAEILVRCEQHRGPLMAVAENRVIVNARVQFRNVEDIVSTGPQTLHNL
jgi:hypothetical protein